VALGQVFSENFGFPCQSTFHHVLHNHLHYHPRLAQSARWGRRAFIIIGKKKKKKKKTHNNNIMRKPFYGNMLNWFSELLPY
jgi:hypothetical protein